MRISKALAALLLAATAAHAHAQFPVFGSQFWVSSPSNPQYEQSLASVGSAGDFIMTWTTVDGRVLGRRFSPTGAPIGDEIQISASTLEQQGGSQVVSNAAGDFVVTWHAYAPSGLADSGTRARRFDSSFMPLGDDLVLDQDTTFGQGNPAIAFDSDGEFVVVWQSGTYVYGSYGTGPGQDGQGFGIFGRRFDSDGNPLGDEFQVNQYTPRDQVSPSIAMNAGGDFIVVWTNWQQGKIKARRYDAAGAPLDGEFQVNPDNQFFPGGYGGGYADVALGGDGKAIVVWENHLLDFGGLEINVHGQILDASGSKFGPELNVNAYTAYSQLRPKAAAGPDGQFAVVWFGHGEVGDGADMLAQLFDSTGRRIGGELPLNAPTTGWQGLPAIAAQPNGQFVAAWRNQDDGSDPRVAGRVFGFPGTASTQVDVPHGGSLVTPSGSSNLNGVLEAGEQVAVEPAYRNSSSDPISLSGTASNLQGPAGPVYTLVDATADYGTIDSGESSNCFDATGDCFVVAVSGARPTPHWDATFDETLSYNGFTRKATIHIGESFADVPVDHPFYALIENLVHNGVTAGCAGGGYCPADGVTRAQMAVFLLKARSGADVRPRAGDRNRLLRRRPPWIRSRPGSKSSRAKAATGGCGGGLFCPNNTVTRQQMAVFLLKALEGSTYVPPACTGVFDDVPCTPGTGFSDWIEELADRGITGGCSVTPPLYCPTNPNNRGQMAVFLTKMFGLVLYGG